MVGEIRAGAGTRAAALRRARAAQAPAEAARRVRQLRAEAALAAYFEEAGQAGRIRRAAGTRAARIVAEGENAAAVHDLAAARAVGELRDLGEVNAEIARMCGISVQAVRRLAAIARAGAGPGGDADPDGVRACVPGTGPRP